MANFTTKSGKTFEIKARTRRVDREFQEAISDGIMVSPTGEISNISAKNVQKANDILVAGLTGLSQDEIDNLTAEEFNEILAEINKNDAKNA